MAHAGGASRRRQGREKEGGESVYQGERERARGHGGRVGDGRRGAPGWRCSATPAVVGRGRRSWSRQRPTIQGERERVVWGKKRREKRERREREEIERDLERES